MARERALRLAEGALVVGHGCSCRPDSGLSRIARAGGRVSLLIPTRRTGPQSGRLSNCHYSPVAVFEVLSPDDSVARTMKKGERYEPDSEYRIF